uniref:Uncharacterized protein n=1 Tax=Labrus bergylta TaxID=56723 RepID=A0A3Q3G3G6_9LABR
SRVIRSKFSLWCFCSSKNFVTHSQTAFLSCSGLCCCSVPRCLFTFIFYGSYLGKSPEPPSPLTGIVSSCEEHMGMARSGESPEKSSCKYLDIIQSAYVKTAIVFTLNQHCFLTLFFSKLVNLGRAIVPL